MRVAHQYDSSFVLQYILHKLEQSNTINVKEISAYFGYDESSIYKLLKKIGINFVLIDHQCNVKRIGCGIYKMFKSSEIDEDSEK